MMDFEDAAQRLARDQSKMRGRRKGGIAISAKARQQAEYQRKQQVRLRNERERSKRNEAYRRQLMHDCQRRLKEKSLGAPSLNGKPSPLFLKPTSIHGDGDKVALPPSVLQTLTSQNYSQNDDGMDGSPWTFRVGILKPDYQFPSSPLFGVLQAPSTEDENMSDNEDDENSQSQQNVLYLDELKHKYLAYTHCTVVEFTQDEGHIGIPKHIAQALLDPTNRHETNRNVDIPKTITVDPAAPTETSFTDNSTEDSTDKTPGHLAWGAFEIPDLQLELTMLKLPKGTGCKLEPTEEAVRNNFYGLKDVKLVLEQSLIRTRATLSIGDEVSTWFRGKKFDLKVTKVLPSSFHAITCINTDIEVEIGEPKESKGDVQQESGTVDNIPETKNKNTGFRLGTSQSATPAFQTDDVALLQGGRAQVLPVSLLPEPPIDQNAGVCTIQIKYRGGNGKRRFDIATAQVKDLFAFAASLIQQNERTFRLVTRFPRREISLVDVDQSRHNNSNTQSKANSELTLKQVGIQQGQEMFIIEGL